MHAVWFASLEGKIKAEQVLRYSCVLFENIKNAKSFARPVVLALKDFLSDGVRIPTFIVIFPPVAKNRILNFGFYCLLLSYCFESICHICC